MPYLLKQVHRYDEIAPLINGRYNKPNMKDPKAKEQFYDEYKECDLIIRSALEQFGDIDTFGKATFSMGNPWNNCRAIGITVNNDRLFSKALIDALWTAVQKLPTDYLILLSGEYEPGGGTFTICIQRDKDVVGYAPEEWMLTSFGFP